MLTTLLVKRVPTDVRRRPEYHLAKRAPFDVPIQAPELRLSDHVIPLNTVSRDSGTVYCAQAPPRLSGRVVEERAKRHRQRIPTERRDGLFQRAGYGHVAAAEASANGEQFRDE